MVHLRGFAATVDILRVISARLACHPKLAEGERRMEAPPGFEPGMEVLQINGVVNRVVSCWSLVCPAPPFCLLLGPYWTTFGLRLPVLLYPPVRGSHNVARLSRWTICHSGFSLLLTTVA